MWTVILVLIGLGLLMVLLEILVIPGGGFAGVLGFGLMATAIYLSFSRMGTTVGIYVLLGTIVINLAALVYALRSKTWDKAMLKTNIDGKVNTVNTDIVKVGDVGRTITRCAPVGKAYISDTIFEVQSRSEFIDEETDIEILKIEGSKIIIKSKTL
ncbi:MAG: hypothetical protein CVT92_00125 [Bacteroidetes bacterium HGW-Bacteroidetes-1]|jgi:membrane-bound ClpP family serine protease|nr:MAG: hypothetical protein CVT92_00125 [Bacteroidetes bacterium HGW-Bacteroidetes-1]